MNLRAKTLFLIDGFGAILSAFLLGFILVKFESTFGMPRQTLYFLALLPCFFALYDFICYFRLTTNWGSFLKGIAVANFTYCCISLVFVFLHYPKLTMLGLIYFLLEVLIVFVLACVELKVSK